MKTAYQLFYGSFWWHLKIPVVYHIGFFGWNHAAEIMAKEEHFTRGGGKWILYVPRVMVK
mgnify:CR=1 FL=1